MKQPPLQIPRSVSIRQASRMTLPNGVSLYTLPAEGFDVLRISFVFRAGSAVQQLPFSASATANLLAEGTSDMTAHEIAERLDFHGSWFDVSIDRDYAYISFATLSKFFRETLSVAEAILLRPSFPEEEVASYCAKRRQRLAIERQKVDIRAREAFAEALFGSSHPYGISSDEAAYDSLTRADIEAFHRTRYTAGGCFVVCSGRIGEEERAAVAAIAGQLPQRTHLPEVPFPEPHSVSRAFVRQPGAVQSAIRVGRLLFPRRHPDFTGMQVVAAALGGYFGSRLMQNLREEHGYTYGVAAAMVNFDRAGYFAVATQTGGETTRAALGEIVAEIERLRREPMPDEELSMVKNILVGETMRILDGPFGIADVTIENILCGTDNSAVGRNLDLIRKMTPADVQHLAQKYLDPATLTTVIAGADDPFI